MEIRTFPARKRTILVNANDLDYAYCIKFPKMHFIKYYNDHFNKLYLFLEKDNQLYTPIMPNVYSGYVYGN